MTEPGLTTPAVAALAVALVAAAVDWWSVAADRKRIEYFAKPAALVLLIGVAVTLVPADSGIRNAFVVALLLGLLGDVALMLGKFVPGAAAFLAGHLAYLTGLLMAERWNTGLLIGAVFVLLLLVPGVRIVRGAWSKSHLLGGIVVVYLVALGAVAVLAIGSVSLLAGLGAALFAISDAMLAWRRFVGGELLGRVAVHITYHLGQALLVLSLVQLA